MAKRLTPPLAVVGLLAAGNMIDIGGPNHQETLPVSTEAVPVETILRQEVEVETSGLPRPDLSTMKPSESREPVDTVSVEEEIPNIETNTSSPLATTESTAVTTTTVAQDITTTSEPEGTIPHPVIDETTTTIDEYTPEKLPEPKPISAEVDRTLASNTVRIDVLGCSGYLINDAQGNAVGAITAEHCGLRDVYRERKQDEQGVNYIETWAPLKVSTGDKQSEATVLDAEVSKVVVPPAGDTQEDYAVLVFDDNKPEDVYRAINEAGKLSKGDTAYLSAWPSDQDNIENPYDLERQKWPMVYLGSVNTGVTSGEYLHDVEVFALKSNEFGAECSFGASGSVAVLEDGSTVGTLAIFDEFIPDTWQQNQGNADASRRYYEYIFGVDLSEYTNICGFARRPDFEDMDTLEVRVAENDGEIGEPDSGVSEEVREEFRLETFENVFKPEIEKSFIDGWVELGKGGPGMKPYIENPMFTLDGYGGAMLYWREDKSLTGFSYMHFSNFQDMTANVFLFRSATDTPDTALEKVVGEVNKTDFDGDNVLQDENGSIFASTTDSKGEDSIRWIITFDKFGDPIVEPAKGGDVTTSTTSTTTTTTSLPTVDTTSTTTTTSSTSSTTSSTTSLPGMDSSTSSTSTTLAPNGAESTTSTSEPPVSSVPSDGEQQPPTTHQDLSTTTTQA